MIAEQLLDAIGLSTAPVPVQVGIVTLCTGLGAKAGWLTVRRKTRALVAPITYLPLAAVLIVATAVVVVAAARGLFTGDAGTLSVYALVLASLLEQLLRLVRGA